MVVVHSYTLAVWMCIITMLCWGSWANTQKLTRKNWGFQLFYWDYSIGIVLLTLLLACTMGSMGHEGRHFFVDIRQGTVYHICLALISGAVFNVANILLVAAIDIAGMAVAFPIAIGLALVIGVVSNYIFDPVGNPWILFLGVALVALGIIVDAIAYKRAGDPNQGSSVKGIVISIISGILMGFFYRFLVGSISVNYSSPVAGFLTPYTAAFIFSLGLFISNFVLNTIMMYYPLSGTPVTYGQYFKQGGVVTHLIGILGGLIWSVGLVFNLLAASPAGYAISYGLGQGATLVAALWGVFIWKEFAHAPAGTNRYIALMFILYVAGLAAILLSRVIGV